MNKSSNSFAISGAVFFGVLTISIVVARVLFTDEQIARFSKIYNKGNSVWFWILGFCTAFFGLVGVSHSISALAGYGSRTFAFNMLTLAAICWVAFFLIFIGFSEYILFVVIFAVFGYLVYRSKDPLGIRKNG